MEGHLESAAGARLRRQPGYTTLPKVAAPKWAMRLVTGNERAGRLRSGAGTEALPCRRGSTLSATPNERADYRRPPTFQSSERATWHSGVRQHYRASIRLWAQAERLYENGEPEPAAELLYMAAKRAINAVANSRSRNPVSTRAKYRQLKRVVDSMHQGEQLLPLWDAACRLHIYADQTPDAERLDRDWRLSLAFITRMLAILFTGTAPARPAGS